MAQQLIGNYYIKNRSLQPTDTFADSFRNLSPQVYEVIRVMGGKPLFHAEHYTRMVLSAESVGCTLQIGQEELAKDIQKLSQACDMPNMNVRVVINNFTPEGGYDYYLYFMPTHYPTEANYAEGVPTALLHAVRSNPHAKIVNQSLRDQANAAIRDQKLYEVILTNDAGEITEGSRSNIFFIRGGELYTSPADGVLLGVTRTRIIRMCQDHGIPVHEITIPSEDIPKFEAAFISGTSPNILPISRVGDIPVDVANPCLRNLMKLFAEVIEESLK